MRPSPSPTERGAEHVGRAARGDDDHRRAEDVELVVPHREAQGPGNLAWVVIVSQQVGDGDALVDVLLSQGGAGRLGGDWLDGLAVNGNLPAANALVLTVFLLPDGQAPLFQQVDRVVNVAANIIDQVFAGQPHHIVDHVVDEVLGGVPAIALAHVAVDGREALAGCAAALDDRLFCQHDALVAGPVFRLEGCAAARHSSANNQDVAINRFCGFKSHG